MTTTSTTRVVRFRFPSDDILESAGPTPEEKLRSLKAFADEQTVLAISRTGVLENVAQEIHARCCGVGDWRRCDDELCAYIARVLTPAGERTT